MCSFGLPVGWPNSSCSRPVTSGYLPSQHPRARRRVLRDAVERVGLVTVARSQVRLRIDHQLGQIRLVEGLDARGERRVAEDENRRAVFARDARGFDRDVEAILHRPGREHDARAVAVAAVDGLEEVALLDVGRQAGARAAALHIDDDERDLRHRGPADRLRLQRDAGTGAAGDGEVAGIRKAERNRDGGEFVLGLHEEAAVFRELARAGFP